MLDRHLTDTRGGAGLERVTVEPVAPPAPLTHPGGSVCPAKRWPDCIHADACWTTPRALCDIDAPIHPDDITTDDARVTCEDCQEILGFVGSVGQDPALNSAEQG